MKELVERFPIQLEEALQIALSAKIKPTEIAIQNIVISGLGGSGIGGSIIADLLSDTLQIPVIINKNYAIPAFVGKNTLFIASSYSGNTEETLEATHKAIDEGAEVACITSGGKILQLAQENNYNFIQLPAGYPPRSCIGYSMVQLLALLSGYGFISKDILSQVKTSADLLRTNTTKIKTEAEKLAAFLYKKTPIIYTADGMEGVAVRFRQQLNENSKMLCWHHILPEMNHNELVGWVSKNDNLALVYLRSKQEYSRTSERFAFLDKAIQGFTPNRFTVSSIGNTALEEIFYLIHLTDLSSVLLADKNEVDAMDIAVIDRLKSHLATF